MLTCNALKQLMDQHPWRIRRKGYRTSLRVVCAAALASVLLLLGARTALLAPGPASCTPQAAAQPSRGTAFVLYTQEYGLFRQTVRSLLAGGWHGQLVVLDNSAGHDTAVDDLLQSGAVEVLRTSGSLNFPQLQNVAASIALDRGLDYYFCVHPGALVLGPDANTSFRAAAERCAQEEPPHPDCAVAAAPRLRKHTWHSHYSALADEQVAWPVTWLTACQRGHTGRHCGRRGSRCVERWHATQPDWGLVFFGSDRFTAVRAKAAADVRWDVFVPQYRADCDFYQSMKVSGWQLLHCDAGRAVSAWQVRPVQAHSRPDDTKL